jgi:hypothetical protein
MPLLPSCKKCNAGDLVPLSDEGRSGGSVSFKGLCPMITQVGVIVGRGAFLPDNPRK